MITVLKINKQGNKVVSYTCTDGNKTLDLPKEQLIDYINKKQVVNAKVQIYQGKPIIRVKEASSERVKRDDTVVKNNVFTILDYINKAKQGGASRIKLNNIIVDVNTLAIIVENSKPVDNNIETDLNNIIAKAQTSINNTRQHKLETEYSKMIAEVNRIQDNKDRIQRIIKSVQAITDFAYKNDKEGRLRSSKGFIYCDSLSSDGIYHKLGLINKEYLGNIAGGACGEINFMTNGIVVEHLTDESGNIINIEDFDKILQDMERSVYGGYKWMYECMRSFIKDLDSYEDKVNEYIEVIKNISKDA